MASLISISLNLTVLPSRQWPVQAFQIYEVQREYRQVQVEVNTNDFRKKCALKLIFFNVKKKIQMVFDIHFECPIYALCDDVAKLGKASWDAYDIL